MAQMILSVAQKQIMDVESRLVVFRGWWEGVGRISSLQEMRTIAFGVDKQ